MGEQRDRGLQIEDHDGVTVVRFSKGTVLDEQASQAIDDQLGDLVRNWGCRNLELDFSNVVYLASGALACLINLNKMLREREGSMTIRNVDPKLFEVFEVTKLTTLFEVQRRADHA